MTLAHWRAGQGRKDPASLGPLSGSDSRSSGKRHEIRLVDTRRRMTATVLIVQRGENERLPGDPGLTPAGRTSFVSRTIGFLGCR